jgi:hypothetical protein
MVSDPDGVTDIVSVTAYFETLGIAPVPFLIDPDASQSGKAALFSTGGIVVPTTAPLGVHEIEIVATDTLGGTSSIILRVDVSDKDTLGDAPLIFSNKAYMSPKIGVNDGETRISLFTFVRDDDNDLESVIVNLAGVGQVGAEVAPDFGGAAPPAQIGDGPCPAGIATIACMQPSFAEGNDGQWFVLPDVTISTSTPASSEPYVVEVIATDATGKTSRGEILISVRDSEGFVDDSKPPSIVAVTPTSSGVLEVVFSEELSPFSISTTGNEFTITESGDIANHLNVLGASINASGNIVTLNTDSQVPGRDYVLTASNEITDVAGIKLVSGDVNRKFFEAYKEDSRLPVILFASATDNQTVDVEFQEPIRPSSVKLGKGRSDYNIKVFEADGGGKVLDILSVQFIESGKVLQVKTSPQRGNTRYRLQVENIASASGILLNSPISKTFKSINVRAIQRAASGLQGDLNGDGKVDFIDFTMFSAVYGQSLGGSAQGGAAQGLSPIPPSPDSTAPHTSQPAGGQLPSTSSIAP